MDVLIFHFLIKISKIRESFVIQSEILVALHIVDIEVNAVQRDLKFAVFFYHVPDLVLGHIAPAALAVTEGPFGNHEASADELAELVNDILYIGAGNDIDVEVPVGSGDFQFAVTGISDVEGEDSRVIDKNTKGFFSSSPQRNCGRRKGSGGLPDAPAHLNIYSGRSSRVC